MNAQLSSSQRSWQRGFWWLMATQFQNAFSDNALKNLIVLLVLADLARGAQETYVALTGAPFAAPFLVFSMFGGWLADRFSKARVMRGVKGVEIGIMLFASVALGLRNLPMELASIFLMGTHSAIFGPSKYGILPEIPPFERLSWGNGLLSTALSIGIGVGSAVAGLLSRGRIQYGLVPLGAAGMALSTVPIGFDGLQTGWFLPPKDACLEPQTLGVVRLPFQNAAGDDGWDDWQQSLPALVRSCLDQAGFTGIPRWKMIQPALLRAGWTTTTTVAHGSLCTILRNANFNPGTGPDGVVYALALQPDGNVIIAGDFPNVSGTPRDRLARLFVDHPPPAAPRLGMAMLAGGQTGVSFLSEPGRTFTLEWSECLASPQWTSGSSCLDGGHSKIHVDTNPPPWQRFCRVRVE